MSGKYYMMNRCPVIHRLMSGVSADALVLIENEDQLMEVVRRLGEKKIKFFPVQSSGYMARAAFVIDRLMKMVGLHGKAFIPLLSGYACAIPAIMATRTLDRRRDRLLVMMVIPLVSCSARLPVYTLIIGTLFPAERRVFGPISLGAAMMFGLYLLSTVLAMLAATVLGRTLFRPEIPSAVARTPALSPPLCQTDCHFGLATGPPVLRAGDSDRRHEYHPLDAAQFPTKRQPHRPSLALHAGAPATDSRTAEALQADQLKHSYAGNIGRFLEPALKPLGFDWKIGIGLIGAVAAREVFVATMGLVYGLGQATEDSPRLREVIRNQRRADRRDLHPPHRDVAPGVLPHRHAVRFDAGRCSARKQNRGNGQP